MTNLEIIKNVVGIVLLITGLFDSFKYKWQGDKIRKAKSARGQSRKFLNAAISNDLIRIIYSFLIRDIYIFFTSLLAMSTMLYCYWMTYKYYPYRGRGLNNFRRPGIILYILNSLLPNRIRKRL